MKVLFAVNDENISTSIVKKYRKQYKEIISYKNVYYFNAILKELQRDKSYDRIVISEDLEEFTSSSYEQKDKFIFDKLDKVSDEALNSSGDDIPIITISTERRTKSEDFLVKLFGIGIYNAIIGDDRSIEEVCRLIYKPRSKKEAKSYYKIEVENVSYEKEDENDVSEIELQNILTHFKKLGKNEDKYVESFDNIMSQYNENQLRVIIAVLPTNVKAVLEERSVEYQRIASTGGRRTGTASNISKNRKTATSRSEKRGTSEKLLNVDSNRNRLSKPVVVPSNLEQSLYKEVKPKKGLEFEDDLEDDDEIESEMPIKTRRRGRPRKNPEVQEDVPISTTNKRRGRPRKNINLNDFDDEYIEEKNSIEYNEVEHESEENEYSSILLPGFDETDNIDDSEEYYRDKDNDEPKYDAFDDKVDDEKDDYDEEFEDNLDNDFSNSVTSSSVKYNKPKEISNRATDYYSKVSNINEEQSMKQYDNDIDENVFESLLAGDKKIVSFVGTSKNGTSFIVNNIAQILSSMGIDTAIFDATQNKSDYYIYTKNDENLRGIAANSLNSLVNGVAKGIKVKNNLTVYTNLPNQNDELKNSRPILETLVSNHTLVLIDGDFNTPLEYYALSQEIYLIQSMDVLTIQPLTYFLRELKVRNMLDENKIRIILNKLLRVRGVAGKNIVGGMANYNDPEMSFMTELFNRNTVNVVAQIPFDEDVYIKYLENLIECEIKINGYPKEFKQKLNNLAEVIYPLLPNRKANKKDKAKYGNSFSTSMNSTLDNMKKRY